MQGHRPSLKISQRTFVHALTDFSICEVCVRHRAACGGCENRLVCWRRPSVRSGYRCPPGHLLGVFPCTRQFISLSLSFLTCKMQVRKGSLRVRMCVNGPSVNNNCFISGLFLIGQIQEPVKTVVLLVFKVGFFFCK